ncbi:hypothetical protein BH23CHL8_BH23CHL8_12890 [soil metagenome]
MLYRVFRSASGADSAARGGPLHVPRDRQGAGRHDSPGRYGAFYAARTPEAAVAESIQAFRGRDLSDADLGLVDGSVLALATFDDAALGRLKDLDDPAVLLTEGWRPSGVASRDRVTTQAMAVRVFEAGGLGLSWWSTLDAAWTNVTLFAERTIARGALIPAGTSERLSVHHPALVAAADHLAIPIAARARNRV